MLTRLQDQEDKFKKEVGSGKIMGSFESSPSSGKQLSKGLVWTTMALVTFSGDKIFLIFLSKKAGCTFQGMLETDSRVRGGGEVVGKGRDEREKQMIQLINK
jgi:hypothetical protein